MDNIIKFVNLEDSDVELVDQCIKDKKRIVTIQKKLDLSQQTRKKTAAS